MKIFRMRVLGIVILIAASLVSASLSEASGSWPNEPAGSHVLTESEFACIACNGWGLVGDSRTHIFSDPTSPGATRNVLRMTFPAGVPGGTGVGNVYYPLPGGGVQNLYAGFRWKPSSTWNGGSTGGQKINFMIGQDFNWSLILLFYQGRINVYYANNAGVNNCHLPNTWGDCPGSRQIFPNAYSPTITLDRWYQLEVYIKLSTTPTSRDGIIRWWIDGQLSGNYTTVNFPTKRIVQYEFNGTWGNAPETNRTEFNISYDQARLSTGGSVPNGDKTPPAAPSNVNVTVR